MAVSHVMIVQLAGRRFGVPMEHIVETVRVPANGLRHIKHSQAAVLRGRIVPLIGLSELLAIGQSARSNANGDHAVLVVRRGRDHVGLLVDDFEGVSDIILKPLEGVLSGLRGLAGTALMGDGSVLLVLDTKELV
jgi:two-component system chemotaxis sensor kinase CheA